MHLYFFVRGKFEQVELWKAHAQCAYWKWKRTNQKTGKEETSLIQGALRPSVFGAYEYIFPEQALTEVCSFFGITGEENNGTFSKIGLSLRHLVVRKMFACKKIPKKILKESLKIPQNTLLNNRERGVANCIINGVAINHIGIKKDEKRVIYGYFQELL